VSDEQAKAVQEVAKTTGEIVKAAGGVGTYLTRVLGSVPENLLGLAVGDWLEHKRRRHLRTLELNTARILESVDAERITEPNPALLLPLLQSAADEAEPELQEMWAALLANAMLDDRRRVRADYIETLKQMSPIDAAVLAEMSRGEDEALRDWIKKDSSYGHISEQVLRKNAMMNAPMTSRDEIEDLRRQAMNFFNLGPSVLISDKFRGIEALPRGYQVSIESLLRHGCVQVSGSLQQHFAFLTAFGRGLLEACSMPATL
jgi:hypothetical protein